MTLKNTTNIEEFNRLITEKNTYEIGELSIQLVENESKSVMNLECFKEAMLKLAPGFKQQVNVNLYIENVNTLSENYINEIVNFLSLYKQSVEYQIVNINVYLDIFNDIVKYKDIFNSLNVKIINDPLTTCINILNGSQNVESYVNKVKDLQSHFNNIELQYVYNANELKEIISKDMKNLHYINNKDLLGQGDILYFLMKKNNSSSSYIKNLLFTGVEFYNNLLNSFNVSVLGEIYHKNNLYTVKLCNLFDIKNLYEIFKLQSFKSVMDFYYSSLDKCKKCEAFDICNMRDLTNNATCIDKKMLIKYISLTFDNSAVNNVELIKPYNVPETNNNVQFNSIKDQVKQFYGKMDDLGNKKENHTTNKEDDTLLSIRKSIVGIDDRTNIKEEKVVNNNSLNFGNKSKSVKEALNEKTTDICIHDCNNCGKCFS